MTLCRSWLLLPIAGLVATPAGAAGRDTRVAAMVEGVNREALEPVAAELSGETPASIEGQDYTFTTRSSSSGVPIDMAERYVYERLLSYGLDSVEYMDFPAESGAPPGRNVIGQIDGTTRADEIVVFGAHLDSFPWTGAAPGADDDASGVSATLYLARQFAAHSFERTVRFVFFGDEENAPWVCESIGSAGYAARCAERGENIVAMIQADAVAYDPPESDDAIAEMITRRPANDPGDGDAAIAELWLELIEVYGIEGLTPRHLASGNNWSDHGSFWNEGYPAVMLIAEEQQHYNPNWHTANDRIDTFDWPLYVALTRSYVAVAAHLALLEDLPSESCDPDTGGDTGVDGQRPTCGCTATRHPSWAWLVLAAAGLVAQRRRGARRG